jgi:hypothetical protein
MSSDLCRARDLLLPGASFHSTNDVMIDIQVDFLRDVLVLQGWSVSNRRSAKREISAAEVSKKDYKFLQKLSEIRKELKT